MMFLGAQMVVSTYCRASRRSKTETDLVENEADAMPCTERFAEICTEIYSMHNGSQNVHKAKGPENVFVLLNSQVLRWARSLCLSDLVHSICDNDVGAVLTLALPEIQGRE
jgi:hypothetical protein